jgi:hypothetical protein
MLGLLETGAAQRRKCARASTNRSKPTGRGSESAPPAAISMGRRRRFFDWGCARLGLVPSSALRGGVAHRAWWDNGWASATAARADLARLQDEVRGMRQMVTLSLLQQQSAGERLRGVDYAYRVEQSDTQVLAALLHAVNHDSNVNVRLAAVDALRKFAGNPSVKGSLDQSLDQALVKQDSPMVQLALIDFMVDMRDKTAVPSLAALERSPSTDRNVKEKAVWGLSQLQ